jgi:hypothetical protein
MTAKNYAASFTVDQSPDDVFAAINNVRGCWPGEIDGRTDKLGAELMYRYQDLHRSTQNADVISAIPSESRHAAALRTAEWLTSLPRQPSQSWRCSHGLAAAASRTSSARPCKTRRRSAKWSRCTC